MNTVGFFDFASKMASAGIGMTTRRESAFSAAGSSKSRPAEKEKHQPSLRPRHQGKAHLLSIKDEPHLPEKIVHLDGLDNKIPSLVEEPFLTHNVGSITAEKQRLDVS